MADNERTGKAEEWQRDVMERLLFATLKEQRRARRWSIFFKLLFAALLLFFIFSQSERFVGESLAGRYTALVDFDGVIDADSRASADNIISGLRAAFESKGTAGVILRANSPGGSPVQAGYIYDEIMRLRKKYPNVPVYGVVSDICASGCYYALAATSKIYANPASMVGSIGVLMDGFGFVDTLKKLGVERRLYTAGSNKGFMDPFSAVNPQQRAYLQHMLGEIHQQFIARVRAGRGKALKEDQQMFSGLVWTGQDAKRMGLVDDFGSASFVAREVIGAPEIVDFTPEQSVFERFAQQVGASAAVHLSERLLSYRLH